jgi:hypothetical protein
MCRFGPRHTMSTTPHCLPCASIESPAMLNVACMGAVVRPDAMVGHYSACNHPMHRSSAEDALAALLSKTTKGSPDATLLTRSGHQWVTVTPLMPFDDPLPHPTMGRHDGRERVQPPHS